MATLDAFLLCDSAARDEQTGKWTLTGVFDAVWTPRFPAVHSLLDVYFRLRTAGAPLVELRFRTPSHMVTVVASVTTTAAPRGVIEGAVRMTGLELAAPGEYRFELYVDGAAAGETSLIAAELPAASSVLH